MRWRWCVAGLLHVEQRFRRVAGYRHMAALLAALGRVVSQAEVDEAAKVA
jgi:hypothetical protein